MDLIDIVPASEKGLTWRTARVIAVKGRVLTVDISGGIDIPCLDSCNPLPDQVVSILSNGTSMLAIGAMNGVYRQATVTVTANATNTVTGLLNGVSTIITKEGSFTPTIGATLPLHWSADGSAVWACATPGAAYVPPPAGGGGTSGGGSMPSSYTTNYMPGFSGYYNNIAGSTFGGDVKLSTIGSIIGFYRFSANRFNDLQGRTILSARIYLPRLSGSGSVTVQVFKGSLQSGTSSIGTGGWVNLPVARVAQLAAGSGATELWFGGSGVLKGLPAGTVQVTWRK